MSAPLPTFVIVGAMRSGTTSLARWLGAHPDVFMAPVKEVHFFDRQFDRGVEWYREQFAAANGETAVGEATPNYLYHPDAIERMAAIVPDARLIAVLRNPVDRAYSHYWHKRSRGRETLDFADAIDAEAGRLTSGDEQDRADYSYVDRGRYLGQLQRVAAHYPRSSLTVLLFEDLRGDAPGSFRRVCDTLSIDPDAAPPAVGTSHNEFRRFRSTRLRDLSRRLPGAGRKLVGRLNAVDDSYPPMDAGVRARLLETFAPERAELASWLGRDLSAWET